MSGASSARTPAWVKAAAQRLQPRAGAAVELAEDDVAGEAMGDDAGRLDGGEHVGDAAHGVAGPQHAVERLLVVDAVLQRHHRGAGTMAGRMAAAAVSVSNDFTQKSTASAGGSPANVGHRP